MDTILNYIKSWFNQPLENTRKRRPPPLDSFGIDYPLRLKVRRMNNSHALSNGLLDENIFSSIRAPPIFTSRKSQRHTPKLVDSICLDDDDDIIEVTVPKENNSSALNKNKNRFTSTPTETKTKHMMNGSDDVQFVADFKLPTNVSRSNSKKNSPCLNSTPFLNGTKHKPKVSPIITGNTTHNPKHNTTLGHSYRLEEKLKYKQLLEKAAPNYTSSSSDLSMYGTPVGKLFRYDTSSRGGKILSMVHKEPKEKTGEFVLKVLDDIEKETIEVTDSDSDVEILPTPPSPKPDIKVEPVNTLKPVIDSAETTKQKWLDNLVRNHREVLKQRAEEIEQLTKQYKTLHDINTDIRLGTLANRVDRSLSIRDYVLPEEEKEEEEELPELTNEHMQILKRAFNGNPNEVLVKKFNLNITRRDILTLQNLNWLNDEVINFYMNLITERGKDHSRYPRVYTMNTFFYPKLCKDGPESLRRWTRRVDIFAHDLICVPVHLGLHWCMAIIDFRDKSIKYYDSMGGDNSDCIRRLRKYLEYEHRDKRKEEYDASDFDLENVKDIPQQMNGSDCGMFSCMFAEYISRNARITFSQENMPYFRKKMVVEIVTGELLIK